MSDLDVAFTALSAKRRRYDTLWRYYDGDQPLRYSTERLRELFRALDVRFVENWCAVVVNAAYDRIQLEGLSVDGDEEATATLKTVFKRTELDLDADDVTLASLVCGESYVIAWKEDDETRAYYHDPRMCHIQYDPGNPRQKLWGAKWWEEDVVLSETRVEKRIRLNLYYPDRLEYYVSKRRADRVDSGRQFEMVASTTEQPNPAANPYNQVPIFQFRRERRKLVSELNDVLTLQDAINKLLSDMMVSSEFSAMQQRYFVTNADLTAIKNAPNEHVVVPAASKETETTQVGQFKAADITGFLSAMDKLAVAIGVITRTPKHYFFQQGGDPSGEALLTQEAPLGKKCTRYINRLANTWQRVGAFLVLLETGEKVDPEKVTATFAAPETVQPKTEADIRKSGVDAGIPLTTLLRREGWSADELAAMEKDRATEKVSDGRTLAQAMLDAQRAFDRDGTPVVG